MVIQKSSIYVDYSHNNIKRLRIIDSSINIAITNIQNLFHSPELM